MTRPLRPRFTPRSGTRRRRLWSPSQCSACSSDFCRSGEACRRSVSCATASRPCTQVSTRASVAASAEGLARALQRLHAERGLRIEVDAPALHAFRGQREDLDEMLGNLLDNACKWARTQVRLTCSREGEQIVIAVDDDGPGIEPPMREAVMRRGVRADVVAQGSGLGLAIVRDLAEVYGGSISLEESPMGGARAQLTLPAQDVG